MKSLSLLAETISQRRTIKVIGEPAHPIKYSSDVLQANDQLVKAAIATAGLAPFHYDRGHEGIPEPWRVHFIGLDTCRKIAGGLADWFDLKPSNKLPAMLSACGCLVLVTWLPQFRNQSTKLDGSDLLASADAEINSDKRIQIDDEHLAATAALVQNLLLLLTADGLGTYWSSGGQLGSPEMFQRLSIPPDQLLLAAVFVEYPDGVGAVLERLSGKNHAQRTEAGRWLIERTLS